MTRFITMIYQAETISALVDILWLSALSDISGTEFKMVLSAFKDRRTQLDK